MKFSSEKHLGTSNKSKLARYRQSIQRALAGATLLSFGLTACAHSGTAMMPSAAPAASATKKVVKTVSGYNIYVNGRLVDTLSFNTEGAAINRFANGKVFIDKGTIPTNADLARAKMSIGGCGGGGGHTSLEQIKIDEMNVAADQENLAAALAALIALSGSDSIVTLLTLGIGTLPVSAAVLAAGFAVLAANNALEAAQAQLSLDQHNAALQGCHL